MKILVEKDVSDDARYCNDQNGIICKGLDGLAGVAYKCKHFEQSLTYHWKAGKVEKCQDCKNAKPIG